jgi:uncharacterized OB-fold protein
MKGSKCKCGYSTVSDKRRCPKCGKEMKPAEWPDEGEVLSFSALQVIPEGLKEPYNMVLVSVKKGPKIICWVSKTLRIGDVVTVTEREGKYFCSRKEELDFKLDQGKIRS